MAARQNASYPALTYYSFHFHGSWYQRLLLFSVVFSQAKMPIFAMVIRFFVLLKCQVSLTGTAKPSNVGLGYLNFSLSSSHGFSAFAIFIIFPGSSSTPCSGHGRNFLVLKGQTSATDTAGTMSALQYVFFCSTPLTHQTFCYFFYLCLHRRGTRLGFFKPSIANCPPQTHD